MTWAWATTYILGLDWDVNPFEKNMEAMFLPNFNRSALPPQSSHQGVPHECGSPMIIRQVSRAKQLGYRKAPGRISKDFSSTSAGETGSE